jgi:CspA family cold shock protein
MQQGTIKFFNPDRGFGFVQPDDGGADVFVHVRTLQLAGLYALVEGDRIEFEIGPSRNKPGRTEACDVKKIGNRCVHFAGPR